MLDRRYYFTTDRTLLCLKILAFCLVVAIMFIFKQWGKKVTMSRACSEDKREHVPNSAVNLAYESENDLRMLETKPRMRGMSLEVTSVPIEATTDDNQKNIEVKRSSHDSEDSTCESTTNCKCLNCRALSNLTECGLCLESLQSGQIKSCPVCANVVCVSCANRLSKCAFCRSELPPERNRALERLVYRLMLPCKNSRSGCKILLDGESRFVHESVCNFATIGCPVGRGVCSWRGTIATVKQHLQSIHNLQPLRDHGISVEIHNFRNKARAMDGRVYTVCLACYDQLFVIRVVLFQSRLRLSFTRLGHESVQPASSSPLPRHGVSVSIRAHAGRRLRGLVPFGRYDRESREVTLTCDNLYPIPTSAEKSSSESCPHKTADGDKHARCKGDLVKIDLLVKQLEEDGRA